MTNIQILYEGPIVKRKDAIARGLSRYFTGKPCKYGHVSERRTHVGECCECKSIVNTLRRREYPEYMDEYRKTNSDKIILKNKEYRKNNPEKNAAHGRIRRARVVGVSGTHTDKDVLGILKSQSNLCAEPTCRKDLSDGYHVDHIMPIALGGSNWPDNLQCLCPTCNLSKGAKHPIEWAQSKGRLL